MSARLFVAAILFLVVLAAGFGLTRANEAKPAEAKPDEAKRAEGIDYSKWKVLTPEPVIVPPDLFKLCDDTPLKKLREQKGPHFHPAVKYFANADAAQALKDDPQAKLPVVGTIVKEKLAGPKAGAKLLAYAAMIKREKGYDPDRGDWEYVYADLSGEKPKIERGKIDSCIRCHSIAKGRDYLYRTHLAKGDK